MIDLSDREQFSCSAQVNYQYCFMLFVELYDCTECYERHNFVLLERVPLSEHVHPIPYG